MSILRQGLSPNQHFVLFYDSTVDPMAVPANKGFAEALRVATQLEKSGLFSVVDTNEYSPEELQKAYYQAVQVSVYKQYKIRQVFGSRRHSGWLFGKGVPALLVYERSYPTVIKKIQGGSRVELRDSFAEQVYPRDEGGVVVSIRDYMERFVDDSWEVLNVAEENR